MPKHAYSDRDNPERSSRHVTVLSWDSAFQRPTDGIVLQTPSTGVDLKNMFLVPRISERSSADILRAGDTSLGHNYSRYFWKQYTALTNNLICVDDQSRILHHALKSAMSHHINYWDGERQRHGGKPFPLPITLLVDYVTGRRQPSHPAESLLPTVSPLGSLLIEGHWYLGSIHGKDVRVRMTLQDWAAVATIVACVGQYDNFKSAAVSFVSDVRWVVESVYEHAPFELKTIEYDGSSEENSLEQLHLFFDRRRLRIDDNEGLSPSERTINNLIESAFLETEFKWDNG